MAAGPESVLDLACVDVRMARIVRHAVGFRYKVCDTNRQSHIFMLAVMKFISQAARMG